MKKKSFEYIWNESILNTIESLEGIFCDEDKEKYKFRRRDIYNLRKNIYSDYNTIRNDLKSNYYNNNIDNSNIKKGKIDNHKIAACICYSLIKNKVFSFEVYDNMPEDMYLINYNVAYTSSLNFMYYSLISQYILKGQKDIAHKLLSNGSLYVPKTSEGHDEYNKGRIKTLALNDLYGNDFDILTYSDMVFWIEYYNRQLIEKSLNPVSLFKTEN